MAVVKFIHHDGEAAEAATEIATQLSYAITAHPRATEDLKPSYDQAIELAAYLRAPGDQS